MVHWPRKIRKNILLTGVMFVSRIKLYQQMFKLPVAHKCKFQCAIYLDSRKELLEKSCIMMRNYKNDFLQFFANPFYFISHYNKS